MQLNPDTVKKLIATIGFVPQNGKSGVYHKVFASHNGYSIFVDFNTGRIEYDTAINQQDSAIKVWDRTTSNFSQAENIVVLECVNRLLEKGYAPSCIELEKTYPSGRGHSGRLDVLVNNLDGTPFLMIECKTWGSEYEKEKGKMAKNGGQLFSYYSSARATRYLCLYTSRIGKAVEYHNSIVDVEDAWAGLSEVKDIYNHWNKIFKDNGIFDNYAAPYDVKHKALTYGKLETLQEEHSGKIYNQIMEILRHNAISDKPNAFNKLLNLFVCKIIDEADKNPEDELEFQWLESDTDESLQLRLNDLYKRGMWRFLEIEVIDYEQKEVSEKLASIEDALTKQWIMKMYTDTRLKKSPNFAFVEVQDDRTFELNAKVVREIVELLQVYRFRYEQKHEFLGNFFELLLNTSMKQEAGQFFTPVPITRFITSSLPLRELVQRCVDKRDDELLPTVIDYACGSGHFLTEYMSQMQGIIDSKIDLSHTSPRIKNLFQSWQGFTKFLWAKDTVYGIDLDNRLVKTTKVSAFFNGDGEANIVWANGLDSFTKSKAFRGKLVSTTGKDNGKFDILISNPPYSVEAFKSTIEHGEESFELYSRLTDNSSEIECLFVERMKQLLKVGGWAAVILPSSILTNSGIHSRAREILLHYFQVKAIVELGSNTFMKTNTNTVILFLERRSDNDHIALRRGIEQFFATKTDVAMAGIENAFSVYVSSVYDGLSFADYVSLIEREPTSTMKEHELYGNYLRAFGEDFYEKAITLEKEKLLCFLLTYNQNIVLIRTGKGKQEKQFLGYEFSERRGHEGLHWLPNGTMLYDEADPLNPHKANSYIYRAFLGENLEVAPSLAKNIFCGRLHQFVEYGTSKFEKVINLGKKAASATFQTTNFPLKCVGDLAIMVKRGKSVTYGDSNIQIIKSGQARGYQEFDFTKKHFVSADFVSDERNLQKGDVLINSTGVGTAGRVTLFDLDGSYVADSHITIVRFDKLQVIPKYALYALASIGFDNIEAMAKGQSGQIELQIDTIREIKIPLPPLNIQQRIVTEIETMETECTRINAVIAQHQHDIGHIFAAIDSPNKDSLGQIVECNPSKVIIADIPDDTVISFVEMASVSNNGHLVNAVNRLLGDVRKGSYTYFQENDILIAKITPCMENGKCALATNLTNGIGMGSSEFHVFRCGERILPRYLFGYLNRTIIRNEAAKVMTGASGHRRVPITFYQQLEIPLPSIEEQRQIVTVIEQKESEIARLNHDLTDLNLKKESVLKKYL